MSQTIATDGFYKITDSILSNIQWDDSPLTERSRKLIRDLQSRRLYAYLGEYSAPQSRSYDLLLQRLEAPQFWEALVQSTDVDDATTSSSLDTDLFVVQKLRLSYSNSGDYPLKNVVFYDPKNHGDDELMTDCEPQFIQRKDLNTIPTSRIQREIHGSRILSGSPVWIYQATPEPNSWTMLKECGI